MEKITIIIIYGFSIPCLFFSILLIFIDVVVGVAAIFFGSLLNPITGFYLNTRNMKKVYPLAHALKEGQNER